MLVLPLKDAVEILKKKKKKKGKSEVKLIYKTNSKQQPNS